MSKIKFELIRGSDVLQMKLLIMESTEDLSLKFI